MSYYQVHLYFETRLTLYDPIQGEWIRVSGSIYLPLLYTQLTKLTTYINQNNFSESFNRMYILNKKQINQENYNFLITQVNKENYIFNNDYMPMYYIIQFIENII